MPTVAPAAAQTSRRGSCVRTARPASRVAAARRVGAAPGPRRVRAAQWEGRWAPGAGPALEGCLPRRLPGAGRRLRANWALRVYRHPGPELGPGQPAPGGLQHLHLPGWAPLLHGSALPTACPLRLEPLVSLESLQPLVWARGAAEPLPVWGWARLASPPPTPVSHCLDSVFLSDPELLDPAPPWHTLCALAQLLARVIRAFFSRPRFARQVSHQETEE